MKKKELKEKEARLYHLFSNVCDWTRDKEVDADLRKCLDDMANEFYS